MASTLARNDPAASGSPEALPERFREAGALVLLGASAFLIAAVATYSVEYRPGATSANVCGYVGHVLSHAATIVIGTAAYVPLAFAATWAVILFLRGRVDAPLAKVFGVVALTTVLSVLLEHRRPLGTFAGDVRGGLLGVAVEPYLSHGFGAFGTYLVLGVVGALSFAIATDFAFYPLLLEGWRGLGAASREARARAKALRAASSWRQRLVAMLPSIARRPRARLSPVETSKPAHDPPAAAAERGPALEPAGGPKEASASPRRRSKEDPSPSLPFPALPYRLPETRLLEEATKPRFAGTDGEVRTTAGRIEEVLRSFNVEVKVVGASRGPAVTLFELQLGEGMVVNRLTARTHDLAIRLKSGGVRFVYPIPGKSTVGVEVPNVRRELVRLRELVDEVPATRTKAALPLYLGRDVMNRAVVEDLTEMPHLLIAGQTGSGKSACLNAILSSVLLSRAPEDVRLILIDPKQVEFSKFEGIPHLMCPVVTIARKVPIVLDWVIADMEERYTLLAQAGVRKIADYNALSRKELKERLGEAYEPDETRLRLPYLVVVVDEINDLMVQAKKDMEDRITRIAQKSRAVGIHLILATQRPSVNVITGTIKANLPTRIAFQTAQGNDSRVILDQIGAEDLLGKGDFLFKPPGTDKFVRAQGTWVGDEELDRLVRHVKSLAEPQYDIRLTQIREAPDAAGGDAPPEATFEAGTKDPLFERAVEETIEANRAAASHLQRAFAIGYNRATRILDAMAMLGIVSQYEGSKVRRILVTKEEWTARKAEILKGSLKGRGAEAPAEEPA
jgi:DNA segregation ATPase FtsK/SpoIIIE, S-DNA-T family